MKKRASMCIALLIALCLLLSSCSAGGAFEPALFKVVRNSLSTFFDNATNLLKDNHPLFLDGEFRFALSTDGTCAEQVNSVISAVHERTGVDLNKATDASKPKLRIGIGLSDNVTASDYYIGFSGEDLLITAANEIMLNEALRYFERTFVTESTANLGQGYLYVPGDLAHIGDKVDLIDGEGNPVYTIIYPEKADDLSAAAVGSLREAIMRATAVNLPMQSDFFTPDNVADAKEIIVGDTTREESLASLEELGVSDYYIGISGNKIVINAANGYILQKAVDRFVELFVTSGNAAASRETYTLSLPAALSLHQHEELLLLANKFHTDYTVVYPKSFSAAERSYVNRFVYYFNRMTGANITAASDAQHPYSQGAKEIRIGETNRSGAASLAQNEWSVTAVGQNLQVHATSTNALDDALDRLLSTIFRLGQEQNPVDKNDLYAARPLLMLPLDFSLRGVYTAQQPTPRSET